MVGKRHVTFGLDHGTLLKDSEHLLGGTGKSIRHVKLRHLGDLKRKGVQELVDEARQFPGPLPGWE